VMRRNKSSLKGTFQDFKPLKEYFVKGRWHVAAGLLSLVLVDLLQVLIPQVIKKAIDSLTFKTATSGILFKYGVIIVSIALAIAMFRYIWRYLLFGHARKVEEGLRNRLYDHLQSLSPSFFQRTKTGDLMARATNDINAVRMATGLGIFAVTDSVVLGVTTIVCMLYINPVLTLISLIPAPILIFLTRMLSRRMSSGYERVQKTFADLTEEVREAFAGIRVVKAYSRESWGSKKIEEEGGKYIHENMQLAKTIAFFFPLMAVFANLGLAIVIWMGGRLTILGHLTTGDFVAFISYLYLLAWPLTAIGWVITLIQRGSASMRRINYILEEVPDIIDPPYPRHVTKLAGHIEFKGLSCKYPGQTGFALKRINLTIESGQTVALVGQVGSAKTTLLNTLPRLFDIPKGTVFIDGTDVHDIPLKTLRQNIGFVTQETLLFSDTIRNNILFGRRGISENALEAALRVAQISDEIQTLEKGLDTWLGEKGVTLSGGQRQRLTIARALISDPPIMILDDALSMVDTRTEARILNRIFEFRKHKTNLIVSHRVPTIKRADFIAVLKGGELVETGQHDALMAMGNEYARLYERQFLAQELEIGIT
ncbi:MAG: ABC transporter ATP-binding protein, partial [Desulfobacterales bacterium]|nr:ABC transporter ATP-binding protein [Desulfobacterales bacterium]